MPLFEAGIQLSSSAAGICNEHYLNMRTIRKPCSFDCSPCRIRFAEKTFIYFVHISKIFHICNVYPCAYNILKSQTLPIREQSRAECIALKVSSFMSVYVLSFSVIPHTPRHIKRISCPYTVAVSPYGFCQDHRQIMHPAFYHSYQLKNLPILDKYTQVLSQQHTYLACEISEQDTSCQN